MKKLSLKLFDKIVCLCDITFPVFIILTPALYVAAMYSALQYATGASKTLFWTGLELVASLICALIAAISMVTPSYLWYRLTLPPKTKKR